MTTDPRGRYSARAASRRIAAAAQNRKILDAGEGNGETTFLCACGRSECDRLRTIPISAYNRIGDEPHRFVVAPGHETGIDDVIAREDGYFVVEIKPEFRSE